MAKSIVDLRRELKDAQLLSEYRSGKGEIKRLKQEIFRLKHPRIIETKNHIGSHIDKVAKYIKENRDSKNKQIKNSGKISKHKTIYIKKLVKTKKGYYRPKYIAKKVKTKHKVGISDPYGLNNVWRIPHY